MMLVSINLHGMAAVHLTIIAARCQENRAAVTVSVQMHRPTCGDLQVVSNIRVDVTVVLSALLLQYCQQRQELLGPTLLLPVSRV